MNRNERLDWVDMAKGISIILVVMMHSAFGVGAETGEPGYLHYIIGFATPFRMPEFFLISGLFLSNVIGRSWAHFADRRIVHYFYFYALWAFLQIVFKVALGTGEPLAALTQFGWAIVEPYGVLWFIYMLAVFSAAAKLLHMLKAPAWALLGGAAALQIAPVATGAYVIDQFAEYFVYFLAGMIFAPRIFKGVEMLREMPGVATMGLIAFALINGALVFSPGYQVLGDHVNMGLGGLPVLRLILALAGSFAICVLAGVLSNFNAMRWLKWVGANSIVIYLSFSIPMAATRTLLLKLGVISNTSVLSTIVLGVALVSPLVLYWLIGKTGFGRFLFERPAWARLPGTPVGASPRPAGQAAAVAAE